MNFNLLALSGVLLTSCVLPMSSFANPKPSSWSVNKADEKSLVNAQSSQLKRHQSRKLLVIHSKYCPHCSSWMQQVYADFAENAKYFGFEQPPSVELIDTADSIDRAKLTNLLQQHKLKSVEGVPAFILLSSDGTEGNDCRIVGYSSKGEWFMDLSALYERC